MLTERIRKGIRAIAQALAEGKNVTQWENYLMKLVKEAEDRKVRVKAGRFGFCTCRVSDYPYSLCFGCHKILPHCDCVEMNVTPEEEITRKYAEFEKKVSQPIRREH